MKDSLEGLSESKKWIEYYWNKVETLRKESGLTVTGMADIVGYERSAYHRAMTARLAPKLTTVLKISHHFGFPVHYLLPPDFAPKEPEKWPTLGDIGKCLYVEGKEDLAPLTAKILAVAQTLDVAGKQRMLATGTESALSDRSRDILRIIEGLPEEKLRALETVLQDPMRLNLLVGLANVTPEGLNRSMNS